MDGARLDRELPAQQWLQHSASFMTIAAQQKLLPILRGWLMAFALFRLIRLFLSFSLIFLLV